MTSRLTDLLIRSLREDAEVLAIDKPAGVDVGGLPAQATTPGVVELLSTMRGPGVSLQPINRLSRYESGILLLGKTAGTAARLRAAWKAGRIEQEYVAVVRGRMAKPTLVLGRAEEKVAVSSRRSSRPPGKRPGGRLDHSQIDSRATVFRRPQQSEQRTLVQCRTQAGTTHALRAQLRSAGLRLLGDRLHDRSPRPAADRETCLHLASVRIALREGQPPVQLRCPPPRAFAAALAGERDFERPLLAALARRLPCLADKDTDSFRLLSGFVEDVPGLAVEKFADVLVFQVFDPTPKLREALRPIAQWYRELLGIESVYVKPFVKDRSNKGADVEDDLHSSRPFLGKPAAEQIEIKERGARFLIRPYDGFSVGLFLDQRDNRSRIRDLAAGKEVLNLFAYTCGFSVAAALGSAKHTVSVDVSPKHLEWGKANFAANGIDLNRHLFFKSDARQFLERAKRQGRTFDVIVLDPPSFAHGRRSKGDFSILTDLPALVSAAAELLCPDGVMMVSTNHRKMSLRDLRQRMAQGLSGRPHEIIATPPLPPDFAMDPDHAKSVFVRPV